MRHSPLMYIAVAVFGAVGAYVSELIFDETINWVTVLVVTPLCVVVGAAVGLNLHDRHKAG